MVHRFFIRQDTKLVLLFIGILDGYSRKMLNWRLWKNMESLPDFLTIFYLFHKVYYEYFSLFSIQSYPIMFYQIITTMSSPMSHNVPAVCPSRESDEVNTYLLGEVIFAFISL